MKNMGAHNEEGPPVHTGGYYLVKLEFQIQPKFVKRQLFYKMKYSWAF